MGLLTPLKPVVNIRNNKEYHSNWSSVKEIKKASQQASIDNIINPDEEMESDVFSQIATTSEIKDEEKKQEKSENSYVFIWLFRGNYYINDITDKFLIYIVPL